MTVLLQRSIHWDPATAVGSFTVEKFRNNAEDSRIYTFHWKTEPWPSNPGILRIHVLATNPEGKCLPVAVLSTDPQRPAEEIIRLHFNRWIQENDFKYLDKHYGINQITSYKSIGYGSLRGSLTDRQVPSHLWLAKNKEVQAHVKRHRRLLGAADSAKRRESDRQSRIAEVEQQIQQLPTETPNETPDQKHDRTTLTRALSGLKNASKKYTKESHRRLQTIEDAYQALLASKAARDELDKEVSRLDQLEAEGKVRMNTAPKSVMDALRVIARNEFYAHLQPFKEAYDNYRDDHDYFRSLTKSSGLLLWNGSEMEVHLTPQANYQPKVRKLLEARLATYNEQDLTMPDGSGRKLRFYLSTWNAFEIRQCRSDGSGSADDRKASSGPKVGGMGDEGLVS